MVQELAAKFCHSAQRLLTEGNLKCLMTSLVRRESRYFLVNQLNIIQVSRSTSSAMGLGKKSGKMEALHYRQHVGTSLSAITQQPCTNHYQGDEPDIPC